MRKRDVHVSRNGRITALATALALAWPTASLAAPTAEEGADAVSDRIGLLPLVIAGDAAPEVGDASDRLSARVVDTFERSSLQAVPLQATHAGDAQAPYCSDAVCWQALAREHDVSRFLVLVVHFDDPDYRIEAFAVDGRTGKRTSSDAQTCDLCGIAELEAKVADVTGAMRRQLEVSVKPPPVLVVRSVPPKARVTLDGELVGTTPVELTVVPGGHRITVERTGYVTDRREVDLVDGVRQEIDAALRPIPMDVEPPRAQARGGRALIGVGSGGLVAGAGAIAGGAVMLALHDRPIGSDCSGSNVDEAGRCKYLHDTRAGGIALTAVGGVLLAGGIAMLALGLVRRKGRVHTTARHGGIGLGVSF